MDDTNINLKEESRFDLTILKEVYEKYKIKRDTDGNLIAVDKETGVVEKDNSIIEKLNLATSWVNAVGLAYGFSKNVEHVRKIYAFSKAAEESYEKIMTEVQSQLQSTGNINTKNIVNALYYDKDVFGLNVVYRLFNNKESLKNLDEYARSTIKDVIPNTSKLLTLEEQEKSNYMKILKNID